MIGIKKSSTYKSGLQVQLSFKITQHSRDAQLMKNLEQYFDCGKYRLYPSKVSTGDFGVENLFDITEKIIPFFDEYPILGVKALDFSGFKQAAIIMNTKKGHLTKEGFDQIVKIKAGINTGRMDQQ
jgi:hypothetical protein